jgi:hypothetical protein
VLQANALDAFPPSHGIAKHYVDMGGYVASTHNAFDKQFSPIFENIVNQRVVHK